MTSKHSIAVIPFVNMSSDTENEYFSDGISEEIINALAKIEGLHVTARTSSFTFKGKKLDIREIGKILDVAMLLEGSVRKSGNNVRITAQLIKAEDGFHVWSETWDRELKDVFNLQDEIAALIAMKVIADINIPKTQPEKEVESSEAYDYYLKGLYILNKWNHLEATKAIEYFEKAIELDSKLEQAYIQMSSCYTWLGSIGEIDQVEVYKKVQYCIENVLKYNKNSPDVYEILASRNYWIEWNPNEALKNVNKALELKPSFPDALLSKGLIYASLGRIEESLDCFFEADRLNPFSENLNHCISLIYSLTGELDKANEYVEKNIKNCPTWAAQYWTKFEILSKKKDFEGLKTLLQMFEETQNEAVSLDELKMYYYALVADTDKFQKQVDLVNKKVKDNPQFEYLSIWYFALSYLALEDNEIALDYLEKGLKMRCSPFLFLNIDNTWDKVRQNKRFISLMKGFQFAVNEVTESKKYKKSGLTEKEAQEIISNLKKLMDDKKPYINPKLNLSDLAELINISGNQLSQLLNEFIGRNFYDFVNKYRLEYLRQIKKESKYHNFTLLALAYECGFNSKTTFNTFFKKELGKTPSEYFKQ